MGSGHHSWPEQMPFTPEIASGSRDFNGPAGRRKRLQVSSSETPMTHIAGLDGCKKGWIALYRALEESIIESRIVTSVEKLFAAIDDLAVLAIDIPIGLTESGPRQCDVMA